MKLSNRILAIVFCVFIFALSAAHILVPDVEYSEGEKRNLQQFPELSFSTFFSAKFGSEFDTYLSDQFPARDFFVGIKNELTILSGQQESHGVFPVGDRLIEAFRDPNLSRFEINLNAIKKLAEKTDKKVTLLLVPESVSVFADLLPEGAGNYDQQQLVDKINETLDGLATVVYPLETMQQNTDKHIYFNTDHHWTSLGAALGYQSLQEALGLPVSALPELENLGEFYGTMYYKSGLYSTAPDPFEVGKVDLSQVKVTLSDGMTLTEIGLYDESYLDKVDKYSYFQGGNRPLLSITNGNADSRSVLVLKDSYANALLPYMTQDFARMEVMDMRYVRMSPAMYAQMQQLDEIVLVYSLSTLCTEEALLFIGQ